ncbi:MAG: tetratricopeptide repeat protein [Pyrinomonadaceae bacterium]
MKEHLINLSEAETNPALAAAYLAENIGSSDGHAEAMREMVLHFAARGEVDLAAEFADTIKDNFERDNLLVRIAEKCADGGDDEYAFQLAEAIEDFGLQQAARQRIAFQKAVRGEFSEALKITNELSHPDDALAAIAVRQMLNENEAEARQTLSRIEYPAAKVQALQTIAGHFYAENKPEKAGEFLAEAFKEIRDIELPEEKIRTLLAVAGQYIEAARFDKAIEVLGKARSETEVLDSSHREGFLSVASLDFLRAGSLDLADRTLDLIADKTQIAATLAGFAAEFARQSETSDALDALEEAYAILKSQKDREVRDSRLRFNLLGVIAARFAAFEKNERALEIALENPSEDERNNALAQIAVICANQGNDEAARSAVSAIEDENTRAIALLSVSDAETSTDENEKAANFLNEATSLVKNIQQPSARSQALNEIAERFFKAGDAEKSRLAAAESLQAVKQITDESLRAVALLRLAEVFEICKFELNDAERQTISTLIRKAEW